MAFRWTMLWLGCLSLGLTALARSPTDAAPTPAAVDSGSSSGQPHSASTPAPPACNAPLPDDDTVSRYRSLSSAERGRRLREAALEGAAGEVRALLAAGADVGARDEYGYTALHKAAASGHVGVVSCLLASGAEVDARDMRQETPLHWAAFFRRTDVLRLLAAASADLSTRDKEGRTALHKALRGGSAEAAAALLELGADRRMRDNYGRTPLDVAISLNRQDLVELLRNS